MQAERIPPAISGAVASYGTNWFDPGETEYEAWQQISGLTLPDGVLYVAVPWTWMIEAIRNGRAAELQGALAAFAQGLPPADHVLTVCAHPELGQHWPLLRRCGITEVFWPHLALPPAELAGAAVVHPQPLTTAVPLVAPGSAGFADCTGPLAAPRIWAALGKGEVPVFRIEDLALPGDARLWLRACVPCDVNTAMGAPLQDYLATLAADAGAMAQKRDHLAELTLEYLGPGLIQQVHRRLLQLAAEAGNAVAELKSPVLAQLDRALRPKLAAGLPLTPDEAQRVLLAAGSAVMLGGAAAHRRLMRPGTLARLREAAEAALPEADEARRHLDRVLMVERLRGDVPAPALVTTPAPLRVCLFGFHSNRTPLSYAPLRAQLTGRIAFCDSAETADLVVAGFNIDYARNLAWVQDWAERRPALKFAVLSEEPLWDTTWSDGFTEPQRRLPGAAGTAGGIDYAVLNHVTTAIFDFHRLPYFVLTDNRYVSRLRACTARWGCAVGRGAAGALAGGALAGGLCRRTPQRAGIHRRLARTGHPAAFGLSHRTGRRCRRPGPADGQGLDEQPGAAGSGRLASGQACPGQWPDPAVVGDREHPSCQLHHRKALRRLCQRRPADLPGRPRAPAVRTDPRSGDAEPLGP